MGDDYDQGFDDQFNDGLFQTTLHNCRRERPDMWPKSVSEMRGNTSYGQQGLGRGPSDVAHSDQMAHRAGAEPFRYGKAYKGQHEGFRYGKAYKGLHEGYLPLRPFFDSAKGRWVQVDRAGNEVPSVPLQGRREGYLPLRQFFDSAKGRWVWVDRAGNEVRR